MITNYTIRPLLSCMFEIILHSLTSHRTYRLVKLPSFMPAGQSAVVQLECGCDPSGPIEIRGFAQGLWQDHDGCANCRAQFSMYLVRPVHYSLSCHLSLSTTAGLGQEANPVFMIRCAGAHFDLEPRGAGVSERSRRRQWRDERGVRLSTINPRLGPNRMPKWRCCYRPKNVHPPLTLGLSTHIQEMVPGMY